MCDFGHIIEVSSRQIPERVTVLRLKVSNLKVQTLCPQQPLRNGISSTMSTHVRLSDTKNPFLYTSPSTAPQPDTERFSRKVNSKEAPWLMTYPRAGKCLLHEWKESTNYKFNVCFMLNVHRSFRFSVRLQLLASSFSSCSQHFIPCLDITFSYRSDSSVDRNKSWEVL